MELRHIRYFIAVAEELNFTKAAQRLSTAQPSLSQQIRQLEDEIGTPLFQRTHGKVSLTPAGRALLKEAREIHRRVERLATLASDAANGSARHLSIGVNPLAEVKVIPRVVPVIEKRFPELVLTFHSVSSNDQIAGLRDCSIDICFMWGPLNEPELSSEEVLNEDLVVALPATHGLAKARRISAEMLKDLPWIGVSEKTPAQIREPLIAIYRKTGRHIHWEHETNSISGALNMVAAGLGYAFVPEYVARMVPKGVVTRPLVADGASALSLVAVSREGDTLPALASFRTAMAQCFVSPAASAAPRSI